MSRQSQRFSQVEIERAIRAAQRSGLQVTRIEIEPEGRKIVLHTSGTEKEESSNALDDWRARRDTRLARAAAMHPETEPEPKGPLQDYYKKIGFDPKTMHDSDLPRLHKIAEEKWRSSIPGTPLNKRERKALVNFKNFEAGVLLDHRQLSIGLDTAERLAARGFVEVRRKDPNIIEGHVITDAGLAASRELADEAGVEARS